MQLGVSTRQRIDESGDAARAEEEERELEVPPHSVENVEGAGRVLRDLRDDPLGIRPRRPDVEDERPPDRVCICRDGTPCHGVRAVREVGVDRDCDLVRRRAQDLSCRLAHLTRRRPGVPARARCRRLGRSEGAPAWGSPSKCVVGGPRFLQHGVRRSARRDRKGRDERGGERQHQTPDFPRQHDVDVSLLLSASRITPETTSQLLLSREGERWAALAVSAREGRCARRHETLCEYDARTSRLPVAARAAAGARR